MSHRTIAAFALLAAQAASAAAPGAAMPPLRVLITNDDGIGSPGIAALVAALRPIATVTVSAPADNFSGAGQSVTMFARPVRVDTRSVDGAEGYAVHGTPADAAIFGLLRPRAAKPPFDLVISGINKGENVGSAAFVSGTVGAARQAVMMGVPAIAVSQQGGPSGYDFGVAARYTAAAVKALAAGRLGTPRLISINVPAGVPRGVRMVPARGMPFSMAGIEAAGQIDGAPAYRLRLGPGSDAPKGGDTAALKAGYITVSILSIDPNAAASESRAVPRTMFTLPR